MQLSDNGESFCSHAIHFRDCVKCHMYTFILVNHYLPHAKMPREVIRGILMPFLQGMMPEAHHLCMRRVEYNEIDTIHMDPECMEDYDDIIKVEPADDSYAMFGREMIVVTRHVKYQSLVDIGWTSVEKGDMIITFLGTDEEFTGFMIGMIWKFGQEPIVSNRKPNDWNPATTGDHRFSDLLNTRWFWGGEDGCPFSRDADTTSVLSVQTPDTTQNFAMQDNLEFVSGYNLAILTELENFKVCEEWEAIDPHIVQITQRPDGHNPGEDGECDCDLELVVDEEVPHTDLSDGSHIKCRAYWRPQI